MQNEFLNIKKNFGKKIEITKLYEMVEVVSFVSTVLKRNDIELDEIESNDYESFKRCLIDRLGDDDKLLCDNLDYFYNYLIYQGDNYFFQILNQIDKYTIDQLKNLFNDILEREKNNFGLNYSKNYSNSEIIKLIEMMSKDKTLNRVLDICSGAGEFLSYFTANNEVITADGVEINTNIYLKSLMRSYINNQKINVLNEDALQHSFDGTYDVVFCNHPWMIKYTDDVKEDTNNNIKLNYSKSRTDWAFVNKAINSINDTGNAYVIMPSGLLSGLSKMDITIRKEIVENKFLKYVILMPKKTEIHTRVSSLLLVFSKNNEKVTFVDASHCYKEDKILNIIDVNQVYELIQNKPEEYVKTVDFETIANTKYDLNVSTYFRKEIKLPNGQPLKKYAEIFRGYQYTGKKEDELDPGEGEFSLVKMKDVENNSLDYEKLSSMNLDPKKVSHYCLQNDDILITTKASVLKLIIVDGVGDKKIIPTGNLTVIRVKNKELDPVYLFTFLSGNFGKQLLYSLQTGTVMLNIPKKALEEMNVPILDMDTQEVIKNRFKNLNEELKTINKRIEKINDMMLDIYSDVVGD